MKISACIFYVLFSVLVYLSIIESNGMAITCIRLFTVFYMLCAAMFMSDHGENAVKLSYANGYYRGIKESLIITCILSITLILNTFVVTGTLLLLAELISYVRVKSIIEDVEKENKQCD